MQDVVTTILHSLENAKASRVTGVHLEVGASGHFTEVAVRQYFRALTRGTPIVGADLTITWLPATYQCLTCQQRFESNAATSLCPRCGDVAIEVTHQDTCHVRSIDVAFHEEE